MIGSLKSRFDVTNSEVGFLHWPAFIHSSCCHRLVPASLISLPLPRRRRRCCKKRAWGPQTHRSSGGDPRMNWPIQTQELLRLNWRFGCENGASRWPSSKPQGEKKQESQLKVITPGRCDLDFSSSTSSLLPLLKV